VGFVEIDKEKKQGAGAVVRDSCRRRRLSIPGGENRSAQACLQLVVRTLKKNNSMISLWEQCAFASDGTYVLQHRKMSFERGNLLPDKQDGKVQSVKFVVLYV
jgi:hypothetical protein